MTRPGPDWFTNGYAEQAFRRHLLPHAGQPDFHALQIGAYCGDATVWLMENVLTGEAASLTDVDTWEGSNEPDHEAIDFDAVMAYYIDHIPNGVRWMRATSDQFFRVWKSGPFDFIYVDGSHEAQQVLRDAVHAEQVLSPGGLMAFDDYKWGPHLHNRPAVAIDAFLNIFDAKFDILEADLQVWVRKR